MFKLTRRTSAIALVAAASAGLSAAPAGAQPTGPTSAITIAQPAPTPIGLLLPAVQKVREAAARMR